MGASVEGSANPEGNSGGVLGNIDLGVDKRPGLPESQGPFEKFQASGSLGRMTEAGEGVIRASLEVEMAQNFLESIEGVSPAVREAARKALEESARSLERQEARQRISVGFWRVVEKLGQDPSRKEAERARKALGAAVGVIRETGEAGRAMSDKGAQEHAKEAAEHRREFDRASEPRKVGIREKLFLLAHGKVERAAYTSQKLGLAAQAIREEIARVTGVIGEELTAQDQTVLSALGANQEALQSAKGSFADAVRAARDANYRGWTQPEA